MANVEDAYARTLLGKMGADKKTASVAPALPSTMPPPLAGSTKSAVDAQPSVSGPPPLVMTKPVAKVVTPPGELPPGWTEHESIGADQEHPTRKVYYYHHGPTNTTQWVHPNPAPKPVDAVPPAATATAAPPAASPSELEHPPVSPPASPKVPGPRIPPRSPTAPKIVDATPAAPASPEALAAAEPARSVAGPDAPPVEAMQATPVAETKLAGPVAPPRKPKEEAKQPEDKQADGQEAKQAPEPAKPPRVPGPVAPPRKAKEAPVASGERSSNANAADAARLPAVPGPEGSAEATPTSNLPTEMPVGAEPLPASPQTSEERPPPPARPTSKVNVEPVAPEVKAGQSDLDHEETMDRAMFVLDQAVFDHPTSPSAGKRAPPGLAAEPPKQPLGAPDDKKSVPPKKPRVPGASFSISGEARESAVDENDGEVSKNRASSPGKGKKLGFTVNTDEPSTSNVYSPRPSALSPSNRLLTAQTPANALLEDEAVNTDPTSAAEVLADSIKAMRLQYKLLRPIGHDKKALRPPPAKDWARPTWAGADPKEPVFWSGWMTKEGGSHGTSWKKRFIVVFEERVEYFEKPSDKFKGFFLLDQSCTLSPCQKREGVEFASVEIAFAEGRTWHFAGDNAEDNNQFFTAMSGRIMMADYKRQAVANKLPLHPVLVKFLGLPHTETPVPLRVSGFVITHVEEEIIKAVITNQYLQPVSHLECRNCSLELRVAEGLCGDLAKSPCTTYVDFSRNGCFGGSEAAEVVKDLLSQKYLREILLNQCGLDPDAMGLVGKAQLHKLERLELNYNGLADEGTIALLNALAAGKHADHLQSISLSGNQMGDACCPAIVKLMQKCDKLQYLDLSFNKLTAEGAALLAQELRVNNHLLEVDLSENPVNGPGISALAEAARANRSLQKLSFPGVRANTAVLAGMRVLHLGGFF